MAGTSRSRGKKTGKYAKMCVCMRIHVCVCIYTYINIYINICVCIHKQTHRIFITELFIKMSNKLLYIYATENNTASYSKG